MAKEVIFTDGQITLRKMEDIRSDYELISRWLSDERVLVYYEGRDRPYSLEAVQEAFGLKQAEEEGLIPCIMEHEQTPIGYLQFYPADVAEYQFEGNGEVWALDLFIGEPDYWNRGLGTLFISRLVRYLFEEKGADWVILDPHVDNARAIRTYEKCGFRKIKILPGHEWHEGQYVDCWLMGVQRPVRE